MSVREREALVRLLTVAAVVEALDVSERTVRDWIARGKLPAFRIAGSRIVRVPAAAVERLLEPVVPANGATGPPS
jgi:excisionase family DNA binding protein